MKKIIAGVDEVGRGSLIGPVYAAAVILDKSLNKKLLKDSKSLTKTKREILSKYIKKNSVWSIGKASVKEIEKINILHASLLAMKRAYKNLKTPNKLALIDGTYSPEIDCKTINIIKGDSKSLSIAAASIIAKQYRDKLMEEIGNKYPKYNFKNNAGYGTKEHYKSIEANGITEFHRKSFKLFK